MPSAVGISGKGGGAPLEPLDFLTLVAGLFVQRIHAVFEGAFRG